MLSIIVAVAPRLISYMKEPLDPIVHEQDARLYCTRVRRKIVSYMGFSDGIVVRKETRQSDVSAYE